MNRQRSPVCSRTTSSKQRGQHQFKITTHQPFITSEQREEKLVFLLTCPFLHVFTPAIKKPFKLQWKSNSPQEWFVYMRHFPNQSIIDVTFQPTIRNTAVTCRPCRSQCEHTNCRTFIQSTKFWPEKKIKDHHQQCGKFSVDQPTFTEHFKCQKTNDVFICTQVIRLLRETCGHVHMLSKSAAEQKSDFSLSDFWLISVSYIFKNALFLLNCGCISYFFTFWF